MLPGVSKTAILTLRARAEEHARSDRVMADPLAAEWFSRVEWPAELDAWYGPEPQSALAFRADDIDHIVRRYRANVPALSVVELGCGLSTRQSRLTDVSLSSWTDLDLPPVVTLRSTWGVGGAGHLHIAASVLDLAWMDQITGDSGQQLFIAEGLLYYLPRSEVDRLFLALRQRFAGSAILFDAVGAHDFRKLLENTRAVGTPALWKLERDFDEVFDDFGLDLIEGLDPDVLMHDALERYWHRLDNPTRGLIYMALNSPLLRPGRSGMVLGRLPALAS